MIKILFLCSGSKISPFVKYDFEILQSKFDVRVVHVKKPWSWLKQALICDVIFVWFADLGGFLAVVLAKLFRKKSIVVAGGFDVEFMPEIGYGLGSESLFDKLVTTKLRTLTLRHADLVLCVSNYVYNKVIGFGSKRAKILYNGVDTNFFTPNLYKCESRRYDVITVAFLDKQNILKKGLLTFIEAAAKVQKELPDATFTIASTIRNPVVEKKLKDYAKSIDAKIIIERLNKSAYLDELRNTKIICQLSATETFGVALAEGMSCGCYPVITNRGALNEVVGNICKIVAYNNPRQVADIILQILKIRSHSIAHYRFSIRQRIISNFDMKIRKEKLIKMVEELYG